MSDAPRPSTDNPDDYRMTVGEHLEELRSRLIRSLVGFFLALVACLLLGDRIVLFFCRPLLEAQGEYQLSPQIHFTQVSDPFMVYIRVSILCAMVLASPWILWQLWQFVAAGLYRHERRLVLRHVPLSLTLLITGVVFVYLFVLPWTLKFFFSFSLDMGQLPPLPPSATTLPAAPVWRLPELSTDPERPQANQIWIAQGRVRVHVDGETRTLNFAPRNLMAPIITLPEYIGLVLGLLIVFGLSFQLPLVVMALARTGLVEIAALKKWRRHVYFGLAIAAAAITPGDVVAATLALMVPLCLLYELGILLGRKKAG